jgi:hypothetical protein
MANKCLFLELATELRFEMNAHVVVESLASGYSKGLAGLFISCCTVKELSSNLFANVRPLLDAQMQWRRTCAGHPAVRHEPLCLHLQCSAGNLFSNTGEKKLVIVLPMPPQLQNEARPTPQSQGYTIVRATGVEPSAAFISLVGCGDYQIMRKGHCKPV